MLKETYAFVEKLPGWLTSHEGQFLEKAIRTLSDVNGAIVEIGSFLGKSTICLAHAGERVYAIDPHKGEFSGGKTKPTFLQFITNLKRAGVVQLVRPIRKTSEEARRSWRLPIKFLFIDGLHDYEHAKEDCDAWSPLLVDGGMIAMHDAFCGWEGVGNVAMRYIVYNPEFGEIGVVGSIIFGVKKKSSFIGWTIKLFRQCIIELCQSIYKIKVFPKWIQFILVHRMLRILLINEYSFGIPPGENSIWKKSV